MDSESERWSMLIFYIITMLVEGRAAVDLADTDGLTALLAASSRGQVEVVKVLLIGGAAVNQAAMDGRTALYVASGMGHADVVQMLLDADATVNHAAIRTGALRFMRRVSMGTWRW